MLRFLADDQPGGCLEPPREVEWRSVHWHGWKSLSSQLGDSQHWRAARRKRRAMGFISLRRQLGPRSERHQLVQSLLEKVRVGGRREGNLRHNNWRLERVWLREVHGRGRGRGCVGAIAGAHVWRETDEVAEGDEIDEWPELRSARRRPRRLRPRRRRFATTSAAASGGPALKRRHCGHIPRPLRAGLGHVLRHLRQGAAHLVLLGAGVHAGRVPGSRCGGKLCAVPQRAGWDHGVFNEHR
mmetsp:Transcript_113684/g.328257  ORF Transcript_113684/g.328257 Transcript_113684/m.328257 type:complete len:241 (-) Transcript_113684:434-1156(-)